VVESELLNKGTRHYVLKLHGSIDWFDYPNKGLAKAYIAAGEPERDGNGKLLPLPDRPRMLLGTFNKIRDYFESPYFDLTATFRGQMTKIRCLLVSGYSFGDKGINAVLSEWMRTHRRARIVVLADEGSQCFEHARGAIRRLREEYPNRIFAHRSYLVNCKWRDLREDISL
jgi:SIR2-like domain